MWDLNGAVNGKTKRGLPARLLGVSAAYTTGPGACYLGDCRELLAQLPSESVQLVFTSPPFALRRQKLYGNVPADRYLEWFLPIAEQVRRVLRHDGSFVMELGGAWNEGEPTRSLMPAALMLQLGARFCLCQDFYWHKTRALPSPTEWVCKRRLRCKEAVTQLWWWAKTPEPWCDQRAVLTPYARPLRGFRRMVQHPSGHLIEEGSFRGDNGGAIPPNVFILPGVDGRDPYAARCRNAGLPVHPARMRAELPEFFVRFLTRPDDLVLDPFAGSNTTGQVAESLGRRWLAFELRKDYVAGSRLRFFHQETAAAATSEDR